ncbi:hypothetical protein TNCV_1624581 [Trichonephila clavipes]|nr:hypothetical protein TNCV_1624581 [Trichonephila clavipes]
MAYSICWIRHVGPVLRPPRSLDLTLMLHFRIGQSQGTGKGRRSDNADLVAHLHASCTTLDNALLQRVHSSIPQHTQACLNLHRAYVEHLSL